MAGYAQCKGSGQWIEEQSANDGVFDCINRRDEIPFKKSEKGELVKKQCTPSPSTSVLVFGCWLQTIEIELILLCVWAEPAVLGSAKTALKFKYEI